MENKAEHEKLVMGTLMKGIGGFYYAEDDQGRLHTLKCKKKFRRLKMTPLPGDRILFYPGMGEEYGWLEEILPRKSVCIRPPVANVTCLVIVIAPVPEADLLLTDRMISRASAQEIRVILAVNKADLDPGMAPQIAADYRGTGIPVFGVSAVSGDGLRPLKEAMRGQLCCMTGQSGAGKTTLLNALLSTELETGELSGKISRGKNTTRHAELIEKDGIRVMDTAGFNLLEPEGDIAPETLKERYPEFKPYEDRCRFRECLHDREPGCAVALAAESGKIGEGRLNRYRILLAETRELWKERYH